MWADYWAVSAKYPLSPNGKSLAFVAGVQEPVRSYTEPDMWVLSLDGKSEPINLTAKYDYDIGSGVGGDNRAPRGAGAFVPYVDD